MKKILIVAFLFSNVIIANSMAQTNLKTINVNIIGACDSIPVNKGAITVDLNDKKTNNIGEATINFLTANKIPFIGSKEGLNSILGTPTGIDSIEVISDTKMRAYGWCFSVDEITPDKMPHEIEIQPETKEVTWFYAYSTYDQGKWLDYCVPSYEIKAPQFCH